MVFGVGAGVSYRKVGFFDSLREGRVTVEKEREQSRDRRTTVFIFSNLQGLARYFGRVLKKETIQEEVIIATRLFRHRANTPVDTTRLEFVKLCEARLVRKAREMDLAI